jgi:phospholipid transport system substrate-binding protein
MTIRRRLLALALVALAAAPVAAFAEGPASAPIEALDQGILAVMRAGRSSSFAQRMQMLAPVVQASYDLPHILASSVGPRFAGFAPEVQAELLDVFTQFTVASYVANFDDYKGERFDLLAETRRVGNDEVVQTRLVLTSGEPLKLDYVVSRQSGPWKIVDVLLNGTISRVAVQRSDFRALLGGGEAGPLIASLRSKVARLARGEKD